MFVRLFFPKTTFVCFLKCLSVRFFSKLHFAVFGNVCPFIFHQTALAFLFFNVCPFVLINIRSSIYQNCIFFFFEMFVRLFFPKTTFVCFSKCLSVCFSFKLYVAGCNVCPFVFLLTAFAFFFEKFVDSFFEARLLKTACCFFFLKCLSVCFFLKLHLSVFQNFCRLVYIHI